MWVFCMGPGNTIEMCWHVLFVYIERVLGSESIQVKVSKLTIHRLGCLRIKYLKHLTSSSKDISVNGKHTPMRYNILTRRYVVASLFKKI